MHSDSALLYDLVYHLFTKKHLQLLTVFLRKKGYFDGAKLVIMVDTDKGFLMFHSIKWGQC